MKQNKNSNTKQTVPSQKILVPALSILLLLSVQAQSTPTIDDYIRIIGPANYSCFGYTPTCMQKIIELCNKEPGTVTLNQNTFRYEFGSEENLQRIALQRHVNDIITTRRELNRLDMTCTQSVLNNQTSQLENVPSPCIRTITSNTPNITTTPLTIDNLGRFADSVDLTANTCVNLTVLPALTEQLRLKDRIEYNITFLNQILDPFVTKYNLTQDFNDTTEINTTTPLLYNATVTGGNLYGNWTKSITILNSTDWILTCNSTSPTQGAGCAGAMDQSCADNNINKEWIMSCGATCIGATLQFGFGKNVTVYGFEMQSNVASYEVRPEVYVTTIPFPKFDTACSSTACDMNFQNFTQNLVANITTDPFQTTCGNATFNFTPTVGSYLILRTRGVTQAGMNPRIGEIRPLIANFTTGSSVASITYNLSQNISNIKFAINRTLWGGSIGINVSCDAGANWCGGDSTNDSGTINCCGSTKNDAITYLLALQGTSDYLRPITQRLNLEALPGELQQNTTETQARNAIEDGIKDIFPNATISTNQQIYIRYTNATQRYATLDKYFTNNNKRWAFNYINITDATAGMSNLGTSVYIWENQTLTTTQIRQQVRNLINETK